MLGWELPPHNSGGLGIACYQLCKSLSRQGVDIEFVLPYQAEHDVDFMDITAAHPGLLADITQAGGTAYESYRFLLEKVKEGESSGRWLGLHEQQQLYEDAVCRLAEEREFDLVHAHDWLTFRAALRVKELRNCPIILHVHSLESDRAGAQPGNPFVREIEGLALTLADQIIAVSEHTKQMIVQDYGIPADRIRVVHNSIDPASVESLDPDNAYCYLEAMKKHGYRVVVNVGRLTIQKGLPNLLRAAQKVISVEPKALFLIVGSGEQYYELIELSAELGIGSNVLFADFQRGKNWRDAFAVGDLFVLPSVSEPFGLTPLEAIGYGTPALISKQSGVSEVINNCLKVDYWDIDEMANLIAAAVQNPALCSELHNRSRLEYERLSWDQASSKVRDLYSQHMVEVPA